MLTLLATLTFVRTADILKGVQIPENPGDYITNRV